MIATFFALASLTSPAPQSGGLVELVARQGQTIIHNGAAYSIATPIGGRLGASGGWLTEARVQRTAHPFDLHWAIIGELPGEVGAGAKVLRFDESIGGYDQDMLRSPVMWNGQIGYLSAESCCNPRSVWLDDSLLIRDGDPVGTSGTTWRGFSNLTMTSGGSLIVDGTVEDAQGIYHAIYDVASAEILVREGVSLPGLPGTLASITDVDFSADGTHWAARVRNAAGRRAIAVDGSVLDFGAGRLALSGSPAPDGVRAVTGPLAWSSFGTVLVNDRGDVAFEGFGGGWNIVVRNGVAINASTSSTPPSFVFLRRMDERGAVIVDEHPSTALLLESEEIVSSDPMIDADGDGVADPAWSLAGETKYPLGVSRQRLTMFVAPIASPGGGYGVFRARPYRIDRPFCDGVVNSTGFPAEMLASGSAQAAANETQFQVFGLPSQTLGYFLVSRTPGFTAQPGGSQGNLCLSGSIGRMAQQLFDSGKEGRSSVTVDLTSLPQLGGNVAVLAGETWLSQAWYRDSIMGMATSNFSSAVATRFD